ncbi:hypothetical protein Curi_c28330 [Gottschalkia acidurici 9a]|uniref:Uncharacterized protein n=1 Tax=Gottschalkia acidurici (strain ATCC 7906 / DSM 604 / BCRC 14475 / CIP 104303 / KCTC 5404 / NCIMB 10678 / 9a) TaxID=1128398 RepID=K0B4H3_GOTA9|nr:hypothetical protein [Gottschalkia acidurici]AFS79825.1 hypothetical protein Curi_c28330 [Gottschalkia acidurici 9a]
MFKKILAFASVLLTVGILSNSTYAANDTVQLISPQNKTVTTNNIVLVSGKGKQGTNLTIDAYLSNIIKDKIDFNNIPKDGYVLILSEDLKIGASGNFAKELTLKKGLHKIEVKVVNSANSAVRYIYITDLNKARKELESVNDIKFTETLKQLIK